MKKVIVAFSLLLSSTSILATVPNVFVSGTPAKAAEVNQNFTSLENRIIPLEQDSSKFDTPFTYAPKTAVIGSLIATINGADYVMGALPFKDYASNNIYKIYLPFKRYPCSSSPAPCNSGVTYLYDVQLFTTPVKNTNIKKTFTISGFDAAVSYNQTNNWPDDFNGEYSSLAVSGNTISISNSAKAGYLLNVVVGGTLIKWVTYESIDSNGDVDGVNSSKILNVNTSLDFSTAFFASEIDPAISPSLKAMTDQYKDLINYIRIEKM